MVAAAEASCSRLPPHMLPPHVYLAAECNDREMQAIGTIAELQARLVNASAKRAALSPDNAVNTLLCPQGQARAAPPHQHSLRCTASAASHELLTALHGREAGTARWTARQR